MIRASWFVVRNHIAETASGFDDIAPEFLADPANQHFKRVFAAPVIVAIDVFQKFGLRYDPTGMSQDPTKLIVKPS